MGLLIQPELTLDCGLSSGKWIPRTIGELLDEVSGIDNVPVKILKLEDFANRLQDERKKIEVFKRELPLSVHLISDAITTVKEEIRRLKKSNTEPVLEEFMPSKDEERNDKIEDTKEKNMEKKNWMSSVQLWNSDNQLLPPTEKFAPVKLCSQNSDNINKKRKEEEIDPPMMDDLYLNGKNRTFAPYKGCSNFPVMIFGKEGREKHSGLPALSLGTPEIKNPKEDINSCGFSSKPNSIRSPSSPPTNGKSSIKIVSVPQQTSRKQRRCWSPELHRRFVSALQQLGGAQAATPKQIRELMQVDGLTNDEVKSHLQKYRLHTRKLPSTSNTNTSTTEPVLLGGLWPSQEQCGESSKRSNSQLGSPQDPLPLPGSSTTGGDSAVEDEDDGKSDSDNQISVRDGV